MFHIIGQDGGFDGDDELAIMKTRDTHLLATTLGGPCEDDCEIAAPMDDAREDVDVFLSRPLRLAVVTPSEVERYNGDIDSLLRFGFTADLDRAIFEYETAHGRNPFDLYN